MGRITAGCCSGGAGGGPPSGTVNAQHLSFEDEISKTDDTFSVEAQWLVNFDLFTPGKTLNLDASCWGKRDTAGTDGYIAIYIGGTRGVVDGTLIDSVSFASATFIALNLFSAAAFANPGGQQPVKIVLANEDDPDPSAAATVFMQGLSLVIYT